MSIARALASAVFFPPQTISDQIVSHTTDTSASGTADASSFTASFEAWRAFDGDTTTNSGLWFVSSGTTGWLRYKFIFPKRVSRYVMTGVSSGYGVNRSPANWTAEISGDGTNWTVVDTQTSITWTSLETKTYNITAPVSCLWFRINVSANGGGALLGIEELRLWGR